MTPEQWVAGLDLPNLMRYGTPEHIRGLITTAIREAVAEEREAILELGRSFAYDCCEDFKDAIHARGQP